jgi:hypothetical protein
MVKAGVAREVMELIFVFSLWFLRLLMFIKLNVICDWIFKLLAPEIFCYLPAKITGFRVL